MSDITDKPTANFNNPTPLDPEVQELLEGNVPGLIGRVKDFWETRLWNVMHGLFPEKKDVPGNQFDLLDKFLQRAGATDDIEKRVKSVLQSKSQGREDFVRAVLGAIGSIQGNIRRFVEENVTDEKNPMHQTVRTAAGLLCARVTDMNVLNVDNIAETIVAMTGDVRAAATFLNIHPDEKKNDGAKPGSAASESAQKDPAGTVQSGVATTSKQNAATNKAGPDRSKFVLFFDKSSAAESVLGTLASSLWSLVRSAPTEEKVLHPVFPHEVNPMIEDCITEWKKLCKKRFDFLAQIGRRELIVQNVTPASARRTLTFGRKIAKEVESMLRVHLQRQCAELYGPSDEGAVDLDAFFVELKQNIGQLILAMPAKSPGPWAAIDRDVTAGTLKDLVEEITLPLDTLKELMRELAHVPVAERKERQSLGDRFDALEQDEECEPGFYVLSPGDIRGVAEEYLIKWRESMKAAIPSLRFGPKGDDIARSTSEGGTALANSSLLLKKIHSVAQSVIKPRKVTSKQELSEWCADMKTRMQSAAKKTYVSFVRPHIRSITEENVQSGLLKSLADRLSGMEGALLAIAALPPSERTKQTETREEIDEEDEEEEECEPGFYELDFSDMRTAMHAVIQKWAETAGNIPIPMGGGLKNVMEAKKCVKNMKKKLEDSMIHILKRSMGDEPIQSKAALHEFCEKIADEAEKVMNAIHAEKPVLMLSQEALLQFMRQTIAKMEMSELGWATLSRKERKTGAAVESSVKKKVLTKEEFLAIFTRMSGSAREKIVAMKQQQIDDLKLSQKEEGEITAAKDKMAALQNEKGGAPEEMTSMTSWKTVVDQLNEIVNAGITAGRDCGFQGKLAEAWQVEIEVRKFVDAAFIRELRKKFALEDENCLPQETLGAEQVRAVLTRDDAFDTIADADRKADVEFCRVMKIPGTPPPNEGFTTRLRDATKHCIPEAIEHPALLTKMGCWLLGLVEALHVIDSRQHMTAKMTRTRKEITRKYYGFALNDLGRRAADDRSTWQQMFGLPPMKGIPDLEPEQKPAGIDRAELVKKIANIIDEQSMELSELLSNFRTIAGKKILDEYTLKLKEAFTHFMEKFCPEKIYWGGPIAAIDGFLSEAVDQAEIWFQQAGVRDPSVEKQYRNRFFKSLGDMLQEEQLQGLCKEPGNDSPESTVQALFLRGKTRNSATSGAARPAEARPLVPSKTLTMPIPAGFDEALKKANGVERKSLYAIIDDIVDSAITDLPTQLDIPDAAEFKSGVLAPFRRQARQAAQESTKQGAILTADAWAQFFELLSGAVENVRGVHDGKVAEYLCTQFLTRRTALQTELCPVPAKPPTPEPTANETAFVEVLGMHDVQYAGAKERITRAAQDIFTHAANEAMIGCNTVLSAADCDHVRTVIEAAAARIPASTETHLAFGKLDADGIKAGLQLVLEDAVRELALPEAFTTGLHASLTQRREEVRATTDEIALGAVLFEQNQDGAATFADTVVAVKTAKEDESLRLHGQQVDELAKEGDREADLRDRQRAELIETAKNAKTDGERLAALEKLRNFQRAHRVIDEMSPQKEAKNP